MPRKRPRGGKRKKYPGRKGAYGTKKRSRRFKKKPRRFRKRRGYRKNRKMRFNFKDSQKFITHYKTAIRVTSNAGTCNYVALAPDPDKVAFNGNVISGNTISAVIKPSFMGSFSFYDHKDELEALASAFNIAQNNVQGAISVNTQPDFVSNIFSIDSTTGLYNAALQTNPGSSWKAMMGKSQMAMMVKSAVTGGNVNITIYKVKARYDIPMAAVQENSRPNEQVQEATAAFAAAVNTVPTTAQSVLAFKSLNNLHQRCWGDSMIAQNDGIYKAPTGYEWRQEGTTLYDNPVFLRFFKIAKTYKAELLPGQSAKLNLKGKAYNINLLKSFMNKNLLCKKGSVHFILKVEGALGHQLITNEGINTDQPLRFTTGSRPDIGIMAAAVDCVCFKRFTCFVKPNVRTKIKSFVKYADYADGGTTNNVASNTFIDAAPSDYAASAAVIN